ncbi:SDR family oxidoreductase, partial [Enterococcus faecalis]|uniref:SDR family oxidoreductase n=1 Tax=Enterococcus faecalis TaxID=1351 RepID=UPI00403FB79D
MVHPGATRTEKTAALIAARATADGISPGEAEKALFGANLIGRIVDADEIGAIVAFLASPRSDAINGDAIAAGGGT